MKNGDLPAMPVRGNCVDASGAYCGDVVYSAGLSKRERFAMAAMQGLLASLTADDSLSPKELARSAVVNADALLAELERTK
jgi:hypothetical protein